MIKEHHSTVTQESCALCPTYSKPCTGQEPPQTLNPKPLYNLSTVRLGKLPSGCSYAFSPAALPERKESMHGFHSHYVRRTYHPRPSSYSEEYPEYPLLGIIYPHGGVQGGYWIVVFDFMQSYGFAMRRGKHCTVVT